MEEVRAALDTYEINHLDIDKVTDRLFHVRGNGQSYALKKSSLTDKKLPFWLEVYRTAQVENLKNILPVYVNRQGMPYSKIGNTIYYLTPWLESNQRPYSIDKIYQHLGYIHHKTKQNLSISDEMRENSKENFLVYKKQIGELRKKLLSHVEHFESQHFMSPVDLLVCTQYRDLAQTFFVLDKRLEQYLTSLEDISEWKYCLSHGNLKDSHVLHGNQLFFINWERASLEHPIYDLVVLLKDKSRYYDTDKRLLLDKLKIYTEENRLENHELILLTIYLLDPTPYLRTIDNYVEKELELGVMDYVIRLQRYHRQLLFGISFSKFVEEEYEMVSFDESSSDN